MLFTTFLRIVLQYIFFLQKLPLLHNYAGVGLSDERCGYVDKLLFNAKLLFMTLTCPKHSTVPCYLI